MNLVGDGVHNFIDGLIIGASYLVSAPVGVATTIAVFLHEIPQEIGDFGVLIHGGFTRGRALMMNFLLALTSVLGVVIVFVLGWIEERILAILRFAIWSSSYVSACFSWIEKFAIIDKNNKMSQISLRRSLKTPRKGINSNFSIDFYICFSGF